MKNSKVEAILMFYKDIDLDIKAVNNWLEKYNTAYDTIGGINYEDVSHTNNIANPTFAFATKIAETDVAEDIKVLENRMKELKKLRTEILKEISSLAPIHKAIICGFYLQGKKWESIARQINYSVRQSKNIRCVALEILGKKFARNKYISCSEFLQEL